MSKTILLELTPKEIEVIQSALIKERLFWEESDPIQTGSALIDKNIKHCDHLWALINQALQPQQDVVITHKDLFDIISSAKSHYNDIHFDAHLSDKKVEQKNFVHISLANALILWFNEKALLKKSVVFDFTDASCKFEEQTE